MSLSFLNPAYLVHKVDYVYYKESEKKMIGFGDIDQVEAEIKIDSEKERMRQEEFKVLKRLINVPIHLLKEN